ncbi:MAG: DUF190 domain-containing protein [Aquificae bacterium]|nr:DUF190 domain-containing protein [Aquificota bacterium]
MRCEEALLIRMFMREDDRAEGKPLYKLLVELCHEKGVAGVTVFRGILGYGKSAKLHEEKLLKVSSDLPVVVEIIDCEEKLSRVLEELKDVLEGCLITSEKVKVVRYN